MTAAAVVALLAVLPAGARAARVRPLVLPDRPRVLVVAPHPDDEVLGAGGLLHRLGRRRVPVRVVYVTNGDGWPWAVQAHFHRLDVTPADFLALGRLRRAEARAAGRRLGLDPDDVRFLGFPDGGLAALWRAYWSHPYTSPFTRVGTPPYPRVAVPRVHYEGDDLAAVLTRVLREFRPTVVVVPHPYDTHPDHAHTCAFATEALDRLQARHELPRDVLVLTYLVHHDAWPPRWDGGAAPLPPPPVPDTRWREIVLSSEERRAKAEALAAHASQLEASADFLLRFERPNELFGRVKSQVLGRLAVVH